MQYHGEQSTQGGLNYLLRMQVNVLRITDTQV